MTASVFGMDKSGKRRGAVVRVGHQLRSATAVLVLALAAFSGQTAIATIYYTRANGNWNVNSTWSTVSEGGAAASSFPSSLTTDTVMIGTGVTNRTVTIPSGFTAACADMTMGNNADNTAAVLTLADATAGLNVRDNVYLRGPNAGATSELAVGAGTVNVGDSIVFVNSSGTTNHTNRILKLTISTGTVTVGKNVTYASNNTANVPVQQQIVFSDAGTLNVGGTILFTGPIQNGTLTSSTGTVNFNSASAQTIPIGVSSVTYYNLHFNNAGVKTLSAAISATNVTGNVRIQGGTMSNGGYAIVGNATRTFEVANGATFRLTGTSGMVTGFGTKAFGATSTVDYAGTVQTVSAETYGHLGTSGSGTKALAGAIVANGDINIGSGTTLDVSASNYAVSLKVNWTNGGTFTPRSGTVTMNGTTG